MLQHLLLSQRSSWGHTHQELLLNDLSPVFPKPAFQSLAEAITPGTEATAKLRIIERGTQPSCRSPAHHQQQLKHSQVIIQSFMVFFSSKKVFKPQPWCSARAPKVAMRASSSGLQQF